LLHALLCLIWFQKEEVPYLDKIVASQPLKLSEVLNEDVPLHVHPDAQMLHSSGATESADGKPLLPDLVPSDTVSIVYVVHEDNWARLTAEQRQGVLRIKAVLIIHRFPYRHDGRFIRFDEEGFEELTHLDRRAFVQGEHLDFVYIFVRTLTFYQILGLVKNMAPLIYELGAPVIFWRVAIWWTKTSRTPTAVGLEIRHSG
jgi:hypothetical protein